MPFGFFKKPSNKAVEEPAKQAKHEPVKYYSLQIREVIQETADAITIVFEHPEAGKLTYKPGQFFTLMPQIEGKQVRRAYSVCTSPYSDEYAAVTVKRVEGGLVSNFLADSLKSGSMLDVMEPMGNFTITPDAANERHVVLFGGGSGITPLMSIAKSILLQEPNSRVSLVYANRDEDSIIFNKALEALEEQHAERFTLVHVLDEAPTGWAGPSGLLNPSMLAEIIEKLPERSAASTEYFMCGPEGMMKVVEETLAGLNIPKDKIHKESFVAGKTEKNEQELPSPAGTESDERPREVTVILDGEEHVFEVEPGKTILETALDMDIDLPYSCQSGLCTACRGKCISGKVRLEEDEGLSEQELAEGYVLTCVGHPLTDDVVIEIG